MTGLHEHYIEVATGPNGNHAEILQNLIEIPVASELTLLLIRLKSTQLL